MNCLAAHLSLFASKFFFFAFFVLIPPHVSLIQNAKLQMCMCGWLAGLVWQIFLLAVTLGLLWVNAQHTNGVTL